MPLRWAATATRLSAANTSACSISAACSALSCGKIKRRRACVLCHTMASAPRTGRSRPDKASSPASSYLANSSGEMAIWPEAARMPTAIGRSKRPDSLGKSAGARLTVIFFAGKSKPLWMMAARTRSRLSFTSVSGRPTILNAGRPLAKWASTSTKGAAMPLSARLYTTAKLMPRCLLLFGRVGQGGRGGGFQLGQACF